MGLLGSFPHRCTIQRRIRVGGALGGSQDKVAIDQTNVVCWEQQASAREIKDFEKKGMSINRKIFFLTDPSVTSRHRILITERLGVTQTDPVALDVTAEALPDASAGLGVVFRVMANENTGENN